MGRGRHSSGRTGSDQDDERGTEEWLKAADDRRDPDDTAAWPGPDALRDEPGAAGWAGGDEPGSARGAGPGEPAAAMWADAGPDERRIDAWLGVSDELRERGPEPDGDGPGARGTGAWTGPVDLLGDGVPDHDAGPGEHAAAMWAGAGPGERRIDAWPDTGATGDDQPGEDAPKGPRAPAWLGARPSRAQEGTEVVLTAEPADDPAEGGPGPRRRRRAGVDRPKARRGRRLAALSAAAAVVAIGTALVGLKLGGAPLDLTEAPDCPAGQACAAIASGAPTADVAPPGFADNGGSTPSPSEEESATPTPRSSAAKSTAPAPRASRTAERRAPESSGRPTAAPERTRPAPRAEEDPAPDEEPTEPPPVEEETDAPLPDPTLRDEEDAPLVSTGQVTVDLTISESTGSGYTGELAITNTGPELEGWDLRVRVGGTVTGVSGADWSQQGDTLVLGSVDTLGPDELVVVAFSAQGESAPPGGCELVGGSCDLRSGDSFSAAP
ncbi:hypothetical protein [Sphaerisporangium sp. TRM90804]|uniref:hypothetical protein n=1 Tax=Sphaerisporangium sp. TRM90804 TaxID=3031113 RepID=UPI00244CB046|nr:hypothetical protein [Sphaerisporangium sp. TRM90804]MDH2427599.1 hypothetical protein [Sphaerisporangium sp. TRM90804]